MDSYVDFLPMDRRHALAAGIALPEQATGTTLFADIAGFTPLTDALLDAYGPSRGAEELAALLNDVYTALIAVVHQYGGSVISFSGDGFLVWFAGDAGPCATAAALALQAAMHTRATILPGQDPVPLALKVTVVAGSARRGVVGDPDHGLLDLLAGTTLDRLTAAAQVTQQGEIVLDGATARALGAALQIRAWRAAPLPGTESAAVVDGLAAPPPPAPWPALAPHAVPPAQVQPWIPAAIRARLAGGATFLTELRPAVALFVHFGGLDYDGDPAALGKLDTYVRWAQGIVARAGGTLLQVATGEKGSYLYAAFGAPVTYGNDAARAVAAALDLRAAPPATGIGPSQVGLAAGTMRTGICGGADCYAYTILGDASNLAARLAQMAPRGQVLADATVQQATEAHFVWSPARRQTIKGKAAPVLAYALRGRRAPGGPAPGGTAPIIGRAPELALLGEKLRAVWARQGQIVALVGDAGLGKSRLVAAAVQQARAAGIAVLAGAADPTRPDSSYLAWHGVAQALFGLRLGAPAVTQRTLLARHLAAIDPALVERLPLLGPLLGLDLPDTALTAGWDPKLRKESLTDLLLTYLRARAQTQPLLIVLEDCHWLDELSADLLAALGPAIAAHAIGLLLSYRPVSDLRPALARLTTLGHGTAIVLGELAPAAATALAATRLAAAGAIVTDSAVAGLIARAGGNPLYLEALAAYLVEQDPAAGGDWPASLQSVLLARLDALSEDARQVLKVASIIGVHFPVAHLWGVYPALGSVEVVGAALDDLDRRGLAPREAARVPAHRFNHALTHAAIYEMLPHGLRATLHGQYASWLEQTAGAVPAALLSQLAYHYSRSPNTAKAREYLRRAGDAAAAVYANEAAVAYYAQLLVRLPAGDPQQGEVRVTLGGVQALMGDLDAASAEYTVAHTLGARLGDSRLQARAALGLGRAEAQRGAWVAAITWLREAQAACVAAGDPGVESVVLAELGSMYERQDETAQAQEALTASLARAAAAGDPRARARALRNLGWLLEEQGEYSAAQPLFSESLALYRAQGDQPGIARVLTDLGNVALDAGDYATSAARHEESLQVARAIGSRAGISDALNNWALVALTQGYYAQAQARFTESLILDLELRNRPGVATVLHNLGVLAYERGEYEEALDVFLRSLDIYRELDSRANIAWLVCDMGDVAHTWGDYPTARARYTEAEDLFTAIASQQGHAWVQWKRGRVVWAEGDAGAAEQLFTTSLAYHQEQGDRMNSAWLLSDLGQVAADRAPLEAQARCAESLALFEALDQRPGIALVRSHLGRLALAAGAPAPARQQVGAALALCAGLGGGAVTRGVLISAAQVAAPGAGSARLQGAIDALCAAQDVVLDPWSGATRASAVAAIQAALEVSAYQAAYDGGQGLDWAAALAEARVLLPPVPPD